MGTALGGDLRDHLAEGGLTVDWRTGTHVLRLWLKARLRPDLVNRDLDDELQFHFDRQAEHDVALGMSADEAREKRASEGFDGFDAIKTRSRRAADEGMLLAFDEWRTDPMVSRLFNLKTLVAAMVVLGTFGGFIAFKSRPALYQSQAVIAIIPQVIANDTFRSPSLPLRNRMDAIEQTVLSRTRMQKMIEEFNLYAEAPASVLMEEKVEELRSNIDAVLTGASGTFAVRFTGTHPVTVMKVTETLASVFKEENVRQNERIAQDTEAFLQSQAEEAGARLDRQQAAAKASGTLTTRRVQLETQVLEATYTRLLTSLEEARGRVNMERRQIGEQFVLLDAARLPEKPITPTAFQMMWRGAVVGLAAGLLIVAAAITRRSLKGRTSKPSVQELAGR